MVYKSNFDLKGRSVENFLAILAFLEFFAYSNFLQEVLTFKEKFQGPSSFYNLTHFTSFTNYLNLILSQGRGVGGGVLSTTQHMFDILLFDF